MKKLFALLLALVMVLSMTACGGGRTEPAPAATTPAAPAAPADSGSAAAPAAPAAAGGFEADATIGVSLPWLGTQNWKEAEEMFKSELEAPSWALSWKRPRLPAFMSLVMTASLRIPPALTVLFSSAASRPVNCRPRLCWMA